MGGGIGWWFANSGCNVRFKDISWEMVRKGYQAIYKVVKKGVKLRKIKSYQAMKNNGSSVATLGYNGFGLMDLVIEAVPEDMNLKQMFQDIESNVNDDTIIASNTSSLSVTEMASVLKSQIDF